MKGFGKWLSTNDDKQSIPLNVQKKTEKFHKGWESHEHGLKNHHRDKNTEVQIGILIGRLSRYGKMYAKKALQPLNLDLEEFTFLGSIYHMENPKKSDVILMNLFEPTSGTEILRRLINLNLVKESVSKEDKRSKLLRLTPQGEKILFKSFQLMGEVGTLVSANLTNAQKQELISIMDYLNDFHANLYLNHKEEKLEELIKRFIEKSH
jgi:DNA-binding MarR family transcriptional regulator